MLHVNKGIAESLRCRCSSQYLCMSALCRGSSYLHHILAQKVHIADAWARASVPGDIEAEA